MTTLIIKNDGFNVDLIALKGHPESFLFYLLESNTLENLYGKENHIQSTVMFFAALKKISFNILSLELCFSINN